MAPICPELLRLWTGLFCEEFYAPEGVVVTIFVRIVGSDDGAASRGTDWVEPRATLAEFIA
jgi:hypothetical protein